MKKKIKVFLGGYVNFLNAQNINCRALSEHLDKEKFEVWTMTFWYQNAKDFEKVPGVHYLKSCRPVRFLGWIPYFIGIMRADVAYLPKGEYEKLCRLMARISGCKLFSTIEGIVDADLLRHEPYEGYIVKRYKSWYSNLYSISRFIAKREAEVNGIQCRDKVLYLGTETERFIKAPHVAKSLQNVVMIGNDLNRKKAVEFIEMAKLFPAITFNIVGGNDIKGYTVGEYLQNNQVTNVTYHGLLDHIQMADLLQTMDLMFFPSRSEGFPKVMLETACAGVPTLCYGDYGADEWITTGKDGFVVKTFDEAKALIQNLAEHPEQLVELSKNTIELGKRFDWSVLVKEWEKEIVRLANE